MKALKNLLKALAGGLGYTIVKTANMEELGTDNKDGEPDLGRPEYGADLAGGHLHMVINARCNMRCAFCYQKNWDLDERTRDDMDPKWLYEYCRPLYKRVNEVGILGGEITVAKEGFNYTRFLHENYPELTIHTESNGLLWGEKWRNLAIDNLLYASFSVNAASPRTFARAVWPEGGEKAAAKVQENIGALVEAQRAAGLAAFAPVITMVVSPETAHEVVDFVRLGLGWGCRRIHLLMNQAYSQVEAFPTPVLEWALREAMKMERVLAGKVRLEVKLFLPKFPALRLQREVNSLPLADLEKEYAGLLALAQGRDERREYEERRRVRAERGKKPAPFEQDVISDCGHCFRDVQTGEGPFTRCFDPWHSLQLMPGGRAVQCSWNYAYQVQLQDFIDSAKDEVDWEALLNCRPFRLMRRAILRHDHQGCMAGCPWRPDLSAAYGTVL